MSSDRAGMTPAQLPELWTRLQSSSHSKAEISPGSYFQLLCSDCSGPILLLLFILGSHSLIIHLGLKLTSRVRIQIVYKVIRDYINIITPCLEMPTFSLEMFIAGKHSRKSDFIDLCFTDNSLSHCT